MKYKYSPVEKRILYRVAEQAWEYTQQKKIIIKNTKVTEKVIEDKTFIMPITHFMSNEQLDRRCGFTDRQVFEAFLALKERDISGYNSINKKWQVASIICSAYKLDEGMVQFTVAFQVWQSALDFSKGFTPLDIGFAMQLKSVYSMRMYEMCKQWERKGFRSISMENFREEFGCKEKYKKTSDLKIYVLDFAKKELDTASPVSFNFQFEKVGRKVVNIHFTFYHTHLYQKPKNPNEKYLLSKDPTNAIPKEMREWLGFKLNISQEQINRNIKLFYDFSQGFAEDTMKELNETFNYMTSRYKRPTENVGYFIGNLKAKLENLQEYRRKAAEQKLQNRALNIANKYKVE